VGIPWRVNLIYAGKSGKIHPREMWITTDKYFRGEIYLPKRINLIPYLADAGNTSPNVVVYKSNN
jgi:hypothetical protein